MSKVTKITEEEINKVNELQALYQQKIYQLGQIQIDKIALEENGKAIDARQESILSEWKELQVKENEVVNSMAEKYGKGSLNLKDGTFTSEEEDVEQVVSSTSTQSASPVISEPSPVVGSGACGNI